MTNLDVWLSDVSTRRVSSIYRVRGRTIVELSDGEPIRGTGSNLDDAIRDALERHERAAMDARLETERDDAAFAAGGAR